MSPQNTTDTQKPSGPQSTSGSIQPVQVAEQENEPGETKAPPAQTQKVNNQYDMLHENGSKGLQYFEHRVALRCVEGSDARHTKSDERDIKPGSHFQRIPSQSARAPLGSLDNGSTEDSDGSDLSVLSNMSGLEYRGDSQTEETRAPQTSPEQRTRSLSDDQDSSDLSDLSDISGFSEFEEEDESPILLDARKEDAARVHGHRVYVEQSSGSPSPHSPESQHSQLIKPRSKQGNFIPPMPPSTEGTAVRDLRENYTRTNAQRPGCRSLVSCLPLDDNGFIEFELSNFSIYLPNNKYQPFAMRGLQHLGTRSANIRYLFDGILSLGATRHYIQGVPFKLRYIGNFGEDLHEVGPHIWIESEMNTRTNIFYRLGKPSAEYARFHDDFLWLADFAKHFVDYLQASEHPISLHRFRKDFYQWLNKAHSTSPTFRVWYRRYNKEDFRSPVSVNITFLFLNSMGINPELKSHPIWSEVMSRDIVPLQEIEEEKTIVTQYVYECFKEIRFGHHLKVILSLSTQSTQSYLATKPVGSAFTESRQTVFENVRLERMLIRSRSVATAGSITGSIDSVDQRSLMGGIKAGDVLSVTKDGCQSVWKDEISRWKVADDCWYVYVQKVHRVRDGESTYDAIWLYKPSDTSCAKMKYPYPKELFMSDNCTCLKTRIAADEVLGVVTMRWHGQPSESDPSHFIRQTYLQNERFVTLEEEHKTCEHLRAQSNTVPNKPQHKYPIGSTVLVSPHYKSKHGLEPYEIDRYITEGMKQTAVLRRLRRREEIDKSGEKNELVYTDQMEKVPSHKIQRTCLVRFYNESDVASQMIPPPYNRKGNGNAFYITTRLVEANGKKSLKPMGSNIPKALIQGFNPLDPPVRNVLNGLDLFCGGGNFGRGLEEGGAVRNRWAVDIDKNAIHTYNANVDESEPTKLFYGSVNDMLAQAMKGNPKNSDLIPLPGGVDFISAGSPCQGFSALNNEPNNEKGLRNQSLAASVAAYIDFYRPKYGILENVLSMAKKGRGRDEDVMSQLICAVVGLGYQVQLCVLDAWSFGSPQSRGRLFLTFAAPGLKPMEHPELSHSHPPNAMSRGLGKLANGQAFGARRHGPTPFEWVTLEESMSDLPALGDRATYQCIPFPDHVMAGTLTEQLRGRIEAIPTHPRGMNFYKAWNNGQGPMAPEERERFPPLYKKDGIMRSMHKPLSRAYTRVPPNGIYPCMTVTVTPGDTIMGSGIHWDDQRMFTAMEGRRIQGAPEHEVFLGSAAEVWKILGNSVNRNVSLALGLSIREAWFSNDPAIYHTPVHSTVTAALPELNRSRGTTSLVRRPRTTPKPRTIHRSTGRGVCARSPAPVPAPAHHQSADSSDDESGLTEWTYNFMMSLDLIPSIHPDPAQEPTTKGTRAADNTEHGRKFLKRPHVAFQETSMLPNEKSNKLPRASRISSTGQVMGDIDGDRAPPKLSENRISRDTATASKLQQVARESLRQIDPGYIPDGEEGDGDSNNELEVLSASVAPRIPARNYTGPGRRRKTAPARPRINTPVVISLVSDDDDGDVVFQHQRQFQVSSAMQHQGNQFYAPATASPQLAHPQNNRVHGSSNQRHQLPGARPSYPPHTSNMSPLHRTEHTQRLPVNSRSDVSLTKQENRHPPPAAHLPKIPTRQADDAGNVEQHQNAIQVARRKEGLRKEIEEQERENRKAERREAEWREAEGMRIEAASAVPTPKYVPVDSGDFMAYFQTNRYMGTRSGRAR